MNFNNKSSYEYNNKNELCREEQLEFLMDTYGDMITKLSFSYLKDWGKAEDVTQEVFITCYNKFSTFRGESTVKNWLYKIAINKCKDILRSWQFKKVITLNSLLHEHLKNDSKSPEQQIIVQDEKNELVQKVFSLPIRQREIIILYYYEDLKIREISDLLNINPKTVKTRLHRGRVLLKNQLKGGEFE